MTGAKLTEPKAIGPLLCLVALDWLSELDTPRLMLSFQQKDQQHEHEGRAARNH
jgi:hypothetical protein